MDGFENNKSTNCHNFLNLKKLSNDHYQLRIKRKLKKREMENKKIIDMDISRILSYRPPQCNILSMFRILLFIYNVSSVFSFSQIFMKKYYAKCLNYFINQL